MIRQGPGRALLVSKPLGPPWTDGSSKLVSELVEGFVSTHISHDEIEVFGRRSYSAPHPAIRVQRLDRRGLRLNLEISKRLLSERSVGLHHYFFAPHPLAVSVARAVGRITGIPAVQTICSQPRRFDNASQLCFGKHVVALSRWTADRLISNGVAAQRVRVIPPPMASIERPSSSRVERARKTLGLSPEHRVVVFPGDAEPGGGLQTFVDALELAVHRLPNIRFIAACRPKTPVAAKAISRAKRCAARNGVQDCVRFVGAAQDFHALLSLADVCVLPARSLYAKVDYPYAILEAMSLGLPTIVGADTPLTELAEAGGGVVLPGQSSKLLAALSCDLIEDDQRRAVVAEAGRQLVENRCDSEAVAKRYRALYREV